MMRVPLVARPDATATVRLVPREENIEEVLADLGDFIERTRVSQLDTTRRIRNAYMVLAVTGLVSAPSFYNNLFEQNVYLWATGLSGLLAVATSAAAATYLSVDIARRQALMPRRGN